MFSKMFPVVSTVGLCLICLVPAFAQGGWDVWTVKLRDGREVSAAPLWSLDDKEARYGFGENDNGYTVPRSQISYMSNNLRNSEYRTKHSETFKQPTLPAGEVKQDLVVMDDGRQVSGRVTIRAGVAKGSYSARYFPVLVQNGVTTDLTGVAFIKLASAIRPVKRH